MPYDVIVGRDEGDKKLFGKRGLVFIGKSYVTMGQYTSLSNPIYLDVARSHVIMVSGKRGCLAGETLVFTDKGYKDIKNFNTKEDKILSFNKESKQFEWENAELLEYLIENEELFEITFENNKKLILTREHPLLLSNGEQLITLLWVEAEKLKEGDCILSVGKSNDDLIPLKIDSIKKVNNVNRVYDLSVSKNHSFIANGVVSHNSGKSYSIGAIAEAICTLPYEDAQNICSLMFDTMGIFWTMKFKNDKDKALLDDWGLKAQNVPVRIFAPFGYFSDYKDKGIPVDHEFAIKISELEADDWTSIFNLGFTDDIAVLIEDVISKLKEKESYGFDDIKSMIRSKDASDDLKNSTIALFDAAKTWGFFSEEKGTKISEMIAPGQSTIIDLSMYSSIGTFNVRALIISIVCKKLFNERMNARRNEEIQAVQHGIDYLHFKPTRDMPLVWIFIDEAHEFLVKDGKTPASDALIQLLREGRQPGLSLVLATQQPGKIHTDAMTQADVVISHRVTAKPDLEALNEIMQSYLYEGIKTKLDNLPKLKGSAIILDDNSERIYPCRIRPRFTWHGGEAPSAVRIDKDIGIL